MNFYSITKYVDLNTGEELSKPQVQQHYIIIKTNKHVKKIDNNTCINEYIAECRRKPEQLKLIN